jgi:hypothetical protein
VREVLDGYSVAHERDVLPENRTRRRRELERAVFYEADHGEGVRPFVPLASAKRVSTSFGMS